MATLALPINQLLLVADEAKAETTQVVVCSQKKSSDKLIVLQIAWKTLVLRRKFADLVHRQSRTLDCLVQRDFSTTDKQEIKNLAQKIDDLVTEERDIIRQADELGSEIRAWWHTSLVKLSEQTEHFDSIAESLHVASDSAASTLLGFAVDQFASQTTQAKHFALK